MSTHTREATVRIPTPLRKYTAGEAEVSVPGETVGAALDHLRARHSGLGPMLFGEDGELRTFVNVFVGPRNIRSVDGLDTPVDEGDVVSIIPAVAGGVR